MPVLRSDPTLWCVSAWNDNGKRGIIDETKPELLYRTDFFGGLGWMMTKELWTQVMTRIQIQKILLNNKDPNIKNRYRKSIFIIKLQLSICKYL